VVDVAGLFQLVDGVCDGVGIQIVEQHSVIDVKGYVLIVENSPDIPTAIYVFLYFFVCNSVERTVFC